jgi:hypothetical protein
MDDKGTIHRFDTKYANECDRNVEVAERTIVADTESFGGNNKAVQKIGTSYQLSQQNLSKVDDHITNQQTIWDVQRNVLMDDNTRVREQLQIMTRERDDLLNEIAIYRSMNNHPDGGSTGIGTSATSGLVRSPPSSNGFLSNRAATSANGVVSFQDFVTGTEYI